jgi:hypothetical protein
VAAIDQSSVSPHVPIYHKNKGMNCNFNLIVLKTQEITLRSNPSAVILSASTLALGNKTVKTLPLCQQRII